MPAVGMKKPIMAGEISPTCQWDIPSLMAASAVLPGVALVLDAANAVQRFELPLDREADFVVLGDENTAIGAARAEHDLSGLAWRPRGAAGAIYPIAATDPGISTGSYDQAAS
jgi:hypothetical protein